MMDLFGFGVGVGLLVEGYGVEFFAVVSGTSSPCSQ